jgi:hypothetical protein
MKLLGTHNTTGNSPAPALADHTIEQSFLSPLDGLWQVELILAEPPTTPTVLTIELLDNSRNFLASSSGIVAAYQKDSFINFEFEPIKKWQNKQYQIKINPQPTQPQVALKMGAKNYYPNGEMRVDGQKVTTDLVFRTFHHTNNSYAQHITSIIKNSILNDLGFSLIYLGLVMLLVLLIQNRNKH